MEKHLGLNKNGNKVAVIFREIPGEPDRCVAANLDRLPDPYRDVLLTIIRSPEAQSRNDLFEALKNRNFHDGQDILSTLHHGKFMDSYNTSTITMVMAKNQHVGLHLVNKAIHDSVQHIEKVDSLVEPILKGDMSVVHKKDELKSEVVTTESKTEMKMTVKETAEEMLVRAALLEDEARLLKAEAYKLKPSLKPKRVPGANKPVTSDEAAEVLSGVQKKRKAERDKRHLDKKQSQSSSDALMEKVNDKILRDAAGLGEKPKPSQN